MSIHLQPPVTLVKTEPPTVIKNEPLEEALKEEFSTDIKNIDIVYHPLSKDVIKSEIVLEDILENKHLESVQTQAIVKADNFPFIKTENITQRNKSEDTSDGNVSKGTGQGVVEVRASHEHSNALSKLETDEQSVLNFSKNLNGISVSSRKSKSPKKTDFAECYKTDDITLWEKEKIKVIKVPVIPVEAHEYISLAKDRHVCNHCQRAFYRLSNLREHIEKIHREVTTMYQCPYCTYKSKWNEYVINQHIIQKHKDAKYIQWFQCHLCKLKFKLKSSLTRHMKVHLRHKQMKDVLDLREKRHDCDKCSYKSYRLDHLKSHKLTHLEPEEIQYFYCYHCSYKCKRKDILKDHIFSHHIERQHHCNMCDYKTYRIGYLKRHNKLTHLKPEDIQYFYCYHCSSKIKRKDNLKKHIFEHFKKEQIEFDCYICNFMTPKRESIIEHIKKHSKVENKSEINEETSCMRTSATLNNSFPVSCATKKRTDSIGNQSVPGSL